MTLAVACSAPPPRSVAAQPPCVPAAAMPNVPQPYRTPRAFAGKQAVPLDELARRLARYRAILISEQHDRYDHHLNQLDIVCRVHQERGAIAIGFEAFQQPFQASLDAYVAGEIALPGLLEQTQYYLRWRFDHRLYAPIFEFARLHGIPMVALNVSRQTSRGAAARGPEGLSAAERAHFPFGVQEPGPAYRARVKKFFRQHPAPRPAPKGVNPGALGAPLTTGDAPGESEATRLDRFTFVQWLWDEAMGQRAARYLLDHPERTLIVLAGSGHIAYADAIPGRLLFGAAAQRPTQTLPIQTLPTQTLPTRTLPTQTLPTQTLSVARVLQAVSRPGQERDAQFIATYSDQVLPRDDVWLDTAELRLPAAGRFGVSLEDGGGEVTITWLAKGGGASQAGMKIGDRLVKIDAKPVRSYTEVKLALADSKPGDTVHVAVLRAGESNLVQFGVTLQ